MLSGNVAYAAMTTNGTSSSLYSIDLTTGTAALIGGIGSSVLVTGLALAQTNFTTTLAGNTATFTGSAGNDSIVFDQSGGLLRHNRFTAGDAGYNSDFDFDPNTGGDQTLSAANAAVTIIINGGLGNDQIVIHRRGLHATGRAT